jgi:sulfite dehydrogenase (cytochrome) subunit B
MKTFFLMSVIVMSSLVSVNSQGQSKTGQDTSTVHTITLPAIEVKLKPGPGQEKASTLCNICHSLEYITMQPALPKATWAAEVNKMIKVMGAPINEEDAKIITEYLSNSYGNAK